LNVFLKGLSILGFGTIYKSCISFNQENPVQTNIQALAEARICCGNAWCLTNESFQSLDAEEMIVV
jgi:hypothetical protein